MMNMLTIRNNGLWESDFIVSSDDKCFSIGDYIEGIVVREAYPLDSFEDHLGRIMVPYGTVITLDLPVTLNVHFITFDSSPYRFNFYKEHLVVGKRVVLISEQFTWRERVWYTAKVNGFSPVKKVGA